MFGYRDWVYIAYAVLAIIIVGMVAALSSGPPKRLDPAEIPAAWCQGDGPVRFGIPAGNLLYVHCADGMVKLVQR